MRPAYIGRSARPWHSSSAEPRHGHAKGSLCRLPGRMRRYLSIVFVFALACGPGAEGRGSHLPGEGRTPAAAEVSDDAFAGAVRDLLSSPESSRERQTRLAGVLARQMDRADVLFHKKRHDRGLAAVQGGLYLARLGDLGPSTLGPHGLQALDSAVKQLSQRGDEGRSRAIYEILLRIAPDADRKDAQWHLEALAGWTKDGHALD